MELDLDRSKMYIVAVSGGVDSMVLLDLVKNYNIVVAHYDHQIREDSEKNAEFVENFCAARNIEVIVGSGNVLEESKNSKKSVELCAREMRYTFLNNVAENFSADYILLAHHRDDNIETSLFNLFRGGHLDGLSGMSEIENDWTTVPLMRPLLNWSKYDIYRHANLNELKYWEDSTNNDINYDRNWLRNVVIPMIEERKPGVRNVLNRTIQNISETTNFLDEIYTKWFLQNCISQKFNVALFDVEHIALKKGVLKKIYEYIHGSTNNMSSSYFDEFFRWLSVSKNGSEHVIGGILFTKSINQNSGIWIKFENMEI